MVKALIGCGHEVTVWNRTIDRCEALRPVGARIAGSPADAAAEADFVIAMVRDDEASRSIWLANGTGALARMRPGAIAIESSTLSVGWVRDLGQAVNAVPGVSFLDAPVAGSRPQADARQLIYFVGGDADVVTKAEPVLRSMGAAIHHAGPTGAGAAIKLAVNALFGVQVAVLAELMGALAKAGIDLEKAVGIIGATPVCCPAAKAASASMLARDFAPLFPVELVEKDLGYLRSMAGSAGAEVAISEAAHTVMSTAVARHLGADHITGIVRLYLGGQVPAA
jgi:3-hydroxyisobutyrate dehydrogenase-like beta-hydroxyacid dehydrogenase